MTASSYHVLTVALRVGCCAYGEHVRGHGRRVELHEVVRALPRVARVSEQVVDLERSCPHSSPSASRSRAVQPDCVCTGSRFTTKSSDVVIAVGEHRALAPAEDHVVVDALEAQRVVALQGRVRAADAVHEPDEVTQAVGPFEIPVADLVLLGVEVLLAARFSRACAPAARTRAVDPVARAQARREEEPG